MRTAEEMMDEVAQVVAAGGDWKAEAVMGTRIEDDGSTTDVFGVRVHVRRAGAKRWAKAWTLWQKTPTQPCAEMMTTLRDRFGADEAWG